MSEIDAGHGAFWNTARVSEVLELATGICASFNPVVIAAGTNVTVAVNLKEVVQRGGFGHGLRQSLSVAHVMLRRPWEREPRIMKDTAAPSARNIPSGFPSTCNPSESPELSVLPLPLSHRLRLLPCR